MEQRSQSIFGRCVDEEATRYLMVRVGYSLLRSHHWAGRQAIK